MKTNAEKFIDLVAKLYDLPEKQIRQMENNIPEIDEEFKDYYWDDIKAKVNLYYARKNDKTRPTIAKILALLETDSNVQKSEPDPISDTKSDTWYRPTTKLWSINSTFNKLVDILMAAGVIPNERGEYTNTRSLVDPATNNVILNPRDWLKWKLGDAMMARPDVFLPYTHATTLEQLAVAVQNNLITFKTRDWSKKVGGTK